MIRRAWWWVAVWIVVALVWASKLVGREGQYPWEEDDDA
jgi:hypothetical protein